MSSIKSVKHKPRKVVKEITVLDFVKYLRGAVKGQTKLKSTGKRRHKAEFDFYYERRNKLAEVYDNICERDDVTTIYIPFHEMILADKIFAAFDGSKMTGFVMVGIQPRSLYVPYICSRKGGGGLLMQEVEKAAKEMKKDFVFLDSLKEPLGFYARRGYKDVQTVDKSYFRRFREYLFSDGQTTMVKQIAPGVSPPLPL